MERGPSHLRIAAAAALLVLLAPPPVADARQEGLPEGFEQILPRGRIASIDDPRWVAADQAQLPDEAVVLGLVIDGQARALSINLLNAHEVVNDTIGETPYAAVW